VPQSGCEPFKFSADDYSPYADPPRTRWFPRQRKWKWPADYRTFMGWIFALAILAAWQASHAQFFTLAHARFCKAYSSDRYFIRQWHCCLE